MRKTLAITLVGSREAIERVQMVFKMVETFNRLDIAPDDALFQSAKLLKSDDEKGKD